MRRGGKAQQAPSAERWHIDQSHPPTIRLDAVIRGKVAPTRAPSVLEKVAQLSRRPYGRGVGPPYISLLTCGGHRSFTTGSRATE